MGGGVAVRYARETANFSLRVRDRNHGAFCGTLDVALRIIKYSGLLPLPQVPSR